MERANAKHHAALAIANEENPVEMVRLAFTEAQMKTDLRWEHDGEFEYKDQMYDIISREVKGDTTHFYAYWDKLESLVNSKLNELITLHFGGKSNQQDNSQLVVSLVKALYVQPSAQSTTFFQTLVSTQFLEIEMIYDPKSQGVDGPPPRIAA